MAFDEYGGLDPEAESFDSFAQYLLRSTFSSCIFFQRSLLISKHLRLESAPIFRRMCLNVLNGAGTWTLARRKRRISTRASARSLR
jgi:hypothetical protein